MQRAGGIITEGAFHHGTPASTQCTNQVDPEGVVKTRGYLLLHWSSFPVTTKNLSNGFEGFLNDREKSSKSYLQ